MLEKNEILKYIEVAPDLNILNSGDVIAMIQETGALIVDDHFELLCGLHTPIFFRFALLDNHSPFISQLAEEIASHFVDVPIDAVLVPVTAGLDLGFSMADILGVPSIEVDVDQARRPTSLAFGFKINKNSRVLVVNDLSTSGTGISHLIKLVEGNGADVAGIALFLVRKDGVKLIEEWRKKYENVFAVVKEKLHSVAYYTPEECPLCQKGPKLKYSRDYNTRLTPIDAQMIESMITAS